MSLTHLIYLNGVAIAACYFAKDIWEYMTEDEHTIRPITAALGGTVCLTVGLVPGLLWPVTLPCALLGTKKKNSVRRPDRGCTGAEGVIKGYSGPIGPTTAQ